VPNQFKAALFDLDGVIVDTAKYHFLAWKRIADEEGIPFDESTNERLKGVSRMASLDIILEKGTRPYSAEEKEKLAKVKNDYYVEMIQKLVPDEILPGMTGLLKTLRDKGVKTAICSASKNAEFILDRLKLSDKFDTIVSGNDVSKPKPDPEVFQVAADRLGIGNADCVVFEDAFAGVQAAKTAGMKAVGIGDAGVLSLADIVYPETGRLNMEELVKRLFS
jgi:beta-phosphoglucomutase